ncbi:cytochrome P450 2D6-like [Pelobates fuscus]|uniref:cytochrome P450 2D6-like n=1 Tax=Pelobates fuscus TaxID=191477 RepID=UPI002FE48D41
MQSFFSNVFILGIILIISLLLLDFIKRRKTWARFPPGPPSKPFVGNMLQVDFKNPHIAFCKLTKKYGDVYSLQFFWKKLVVLNGFEVMKEALFKKSEDIADRPRFPISEKAGFTGKEQGVVIAKYGVPWREHRRFSLSTLRDFGMGKKSLEQRVTEEAGFLCSRFQEEKGCAFDPQYLINNAVSNVICSIAFGDRFEYSDAKFQELLSIFEEGLKSQTGLLVQVLQEIPFLMKIPWLVNDILAPQQRLHKFLKDIISKHQKTFDPNCIRDFIDAYLLEMKKVKENNESGFNETNLLLTTTDLFGAGTETTSTTLRWGILFMMLHPEVQSKVHEEIDKVIGRERKPMMGDLLEMPYTNAVIHEIQRCGDIVPLPFPHMAYRDTEIQGYFIPKGTTVITNLSSVLKDEKVWKKPYQFYPEHFLDDNGKFVKQEAFMAFSAGRRACLGERLARMELFLFFTTLMQQFKFEIPNDQPRPRVDGQFQLTLSPHPYKMCAADCRNQWSMSRPLLGLILLNDKYFSDLRSSIVVSCQPPLTSNKPCVYGLRIRMEGIEKELTHKRIETGSHRIFLHSDEK